MDIEGRSSLQIRLGLILFSVVGTIPSPTLSGDVNLHSISSVSVNDEGRVLIRIDKGEFPNIFLVPGSEILDNVAKYACFSA